MVQGTIGGFKVKGCQYSAIFSFLECPFASHSDFTYDLYQAIVFALGMCEVPCHRLIYLVIPWYLVPLTPCAYQVPLVTWYLFTSMVLLHLVWYLYQVRIYRPAWNSMF